MIQENRTTSRATVMHESEAVLGARVKLTVRVTLGRTQAASCAHRVDRMNPPTREAQP
jgi:hypothetical protein